MITNFFEELAEYYCRENDLSNIVVTMCHSNERFKELFIRYFFPRIDISRIASIRREVPDSKHGDSRVDIYITMSDNPLPYIIEVKKEDRNHHFGQYEQAYGISRDRFGYITNYDCIEGRRLGYDVKSWEEFYDYLTDMSDEDKMITGFLKYLKKCCRITKYHTPMDITGLSAIPCFADTAKKIIGQNRDWITTGFYREYSYRGSLHESFTFHFGETAPENYEDSGFAALGLWYKDRPEITIGINARPWLSERILTQSPAPAQETEYYKAPYRDPFWDRNDVWFGLADTKMQQFITATDYDTQRQILDHFFTAVLSSLRYHFPR